MATGGKKRSKNEPPQVAESSSQVNTVTGILDCYDLIAKNEYSEETIGIQAFMTRKHVGNDNNNNFSDIIEDSDKRCRQGQAPDFHGLLDEKRKSLSDIDASLEKCLMLSRLATFISTEKTNFTQILSNIRLDVQSRMSDRPSSGNIHYPDDFEKRKQDFYKRRDIQEKRRLFYFNHQEVDPLQNLVYLQNRTTEHLNYIMMLMKKDPKSANKCIGEIENILHTSFMIVAQPHCGVNPTTIYERRAPGQYTAKISVMIVCLLHDFMQLYPNLIELYPIEPSLYPTSDQYRLEDPQSLSWKTVHLQPTPDTRTRVFKYADLTNITIGQTSKTDTRVRFAQALHSFRFAIKLRVNLPYSKAPPVYQIQLESSKFAIGAHNNQLPQLLTRVILDDIRRFSQPHLPEISQIQDFMRRYFIYRTGVHPNPCVLTFLEQELSRAKHQRNQFTTLEDIYLDFLANFVCQVEFMAKHPILAMFHADNLFLGICNGDRVAEAIVQTCVSSSPIIGLRFNSIRIDYNASAVGPVASRTIKTSPCAIRVDMYHDRTKKFQYRTFDSASLLYDISKFVVSSYSTDVHGIRILSRFDPKTNQREYESLDKFTKYYHERLTQIIKTDEKYKLVTDVVANANENSADEVGPELSRSNSSHQGPDSVFSSAPLTPDMSSRDLLDFGNSDSSHSYDYPSASYVNTPNSVPLQSPSAPSPFPSLATRPPMQANHYHDPAIVLQKLLSQPSSIEILRQHGIYNIADPILPSAPAPSPHTPQVQPPPPPPASMFYPHPAHYTRPAMPYPSNMMPQQTMHYQQQPTNFYSQPATTPMMQRPSQPPLEQYSSPSVPATNTATFSPNWTQAQIVDYLRSDLPDLPTTASITSTPMMQLPEQKPFTSNNYSVDLNCFDFDDFLDNLNDGTNQFFELNQNGNGSDLTGP